ncbi:hypothetical protein [Streptomyces griseoaurantiacus]|uniref:hypothetical protein n=1 Tax=Streptomyces griseoaurantiacus TaxID=68213 RepID=UPI00367B4150
MRRSALKAGRLYAIKPSPSSRSVAPALLLHTGLWDLTPASGGADFAPAPLMARFSTALDLSTGARRGFLAVRARPGAEQIHGISADEVCARLEKIGQGKKARTLSSLGADGPLVQSLQALRPSVTEPLVLDVLNAQAIVEPWATDVRYTCPGCSEPVGLDSADRIRHHDTPDDTPCSLSHQHLSRDVRKACRIA